MWRGSALYPLLYATSYLEVFHRFGEAFNQLQSDRVNWRTCRAHVYSCLCMQMHGACEYFSVVNASERLYVCSARTISCR